MRAGQALHRTEAASGRITGKTAHCASPLPLVATKIELDPILGWAKNEFSTDPSQV
jgi:hypothetical protein